MDGDLVVFVKVALVILVILAIIYIIGKIFQSIFFVIIAAIFICVSFTVFFGDGTDIVHFATSFMSEDIGTTIEDGYKFYKEKEKETPLIDADKISGQTTDVFQKAIKDGTNLFLDK